MITTPELNATHSPNMLPCRREQRMSLRLRVLLHLDCGHDVRLNADNSDRNSVRYERNLSSVVAQNLEPKRIRRDAAVM